MKWPCCFHFQLTLFKSFHVIWQLAKNHKLETIASCDWWWGGTNELLHCPPVECQNWQSQSCVGKNNQNVLFSWPLFKFWWKLSLNTLSHESIDFRMAFKNEVTCAIDVKNESFEGCLSLFIRLHAQLLICLVAWLPCCVNKETFNVEKMWIDWCNHSWATWNRFGHT